MPDRGSAGHVPPSIPLVGHLTLDLPDTRPAATSRRLSTRALPATAGSYGDTDGARRTPSRVGSYVSSRSAVLPVVGAYPDRDGVRTATVRGSYTRVER